VGVVAFLVGSGLCIGDRGEGGYGDS